MDDVLAWSLLAIVVAIVSATSITGVIQILGFSIAFALVMFFVIRPLLKTLVTRYDR